METGPRSPVFYDPEGRRWRRIKRSYIALAIGVTSLAAVFIASVLANPLLPHLNIRPLPNLPHSSDIKPKPPATAPGNPRQQRAKHAQVELQKALATTRVVPAKRASQTAIVPPPQLPLPASASFASKPLSIGFYINWDESSYASLLRNLNHLDWVVPQWAHLVDTHDGSSPIATDIQAPRSKPDPATTSADSNSANGPKPH